MYTFHTNTGCCDICAAIDGKHFKIKDMQIGENAAPMHPHCRCSCSAYEDSEEYEQWLDFLANGGTTEEYNKLKQVEKIGKSAIIISTKQFGKKLGKHAAEFGLNPNNEKDREQFLQIIDDVVINKDEVRHGEWRGQPETVTFYIKGEDVVIVSNENKYITTLKGGVNNERVKNARK